MTARAFNSWEAKIVNTKKQGDRNLSNLHAKFVVLCACDDTGTLIFEPSDVNRLGDEGTAVVRRLWEAGRTIAGITDEEEKGLEKNFDETTPDDSPSS